MREEPFTSEEYGRRIQRVRESMARQRLDLLVLNSPENIYYLTGYETQGIVAHQFLAVPVGRPLLFTTRHVDIGNLLAILEGNPISDYATYSDTDDPIEVFVGFLRRHGVGRGRIGVEKGNWYLLVEHYERLKEILDQAELVDASRLVEEVRLEKSAAELEYHRQAGAISVKAMQAALKAIRPGATDTRVAAVTLSSLINAGSEWIANWPYVKVGRQSGRAHSTWRNRRIQRGEPISVELAGVVRRYHRPLYRTVIFSPSEEQRRLAETLRAANRAGIDSVRAGVTAGEIYEAVRSVVADRGFAEFLMSRTAYSVGIGFPPKWTQPLGVNIVPSSRTVLKSGMVFHFVPYLLRLNEFGMGQSSTIAVTDQGCEDFTLGIEPGPILVE